MISPFDLIIIAVVAFGAALFSGFSGAGGGFITTPLLIFLGLPPAQAVSSGKFVGLSVAAGSLGGMRKASSRQLRRRAVPIMLLAFAVGLIAPFFIINLESEAYQRILGVIILLMIPLLFFRKIGRVQRSTGRVGGYIGAALIAFVLWLQGVFSGGLGTLVNVVLMSMMGMTAIEANIVKRYSQLVLNITIVAGVVFAGLIVWPVAIVGAVSALVGSFIGGRIAVKKGDKFVMAVFLIAMFVSGTALLIG